MQQREVFVLVPLDAGSPRVTPSLPGLMYPVLTSRQIGEVLSHGA